MSGKSSFGSLQGSKGVLPDSNIEEYLRGKGWEKVFSEKGKFLGWYHQQRTGMKMIICDALEAEKIHKEFDKFANTPIKK